MVTCVGYWKTNHWNGMIWSTNWKIKKHSIPLPRVYEYSTDQTTYHEAFQVVPKAQKNHLNKQAYQGLKNQRLRGNWGIFSLVLRPIPENYHLNWNNLTLRVCSFKVLIHRKLQVEHTINVCLGAQGSHPLPWCVWLQICTGNYGNWLKYSV